MKRKLAFVLLFVLLFATMPVVASASYYTGGLLDGEQLVTGRIPAGSGFQSNYNFITNSVTFAVTDDDINTQLTITHRQGFTYTFAVPHNIESYILNTSGGSIGIAFYDENNQNIPTGIGYNTYFYMSNNTKTNIQVENVKKFVVFQGNSSGTSHIREFNLFGSPVEVPPIAPALSATAGNAQVNLSWGEVGNAGSYSVYRALNESGPYSFVDDVTGTNYIDMDVENGSTYYYVVTAVNNEGESDYSNEVAATPEADVPDAPLNLTASGNEMQVSLGWGVSEGAVTYTIKRSLTEGGPYTVIGSVYGTTYTDTNVENGITYYYVVTAVNNDGESDPSNEASAMPFAPEPEDNLRALLTLYLTGGQVKEYDVSFEELDAFLDWFDDRATGTGPERYGFDKAWNKGPFKTRTEYVIFSKIDTFDVDEYEVEE